MHTPSPETLLDSMTCVSGPCEIGHMGIEPLQCLGSEAHPRCHATILSLSASFKKGASQSKSSFSTAGLPRSCTPPLSQRLKRSGSLALSGETSSFSRNSAMRFRRSCLRCECLKCSPIPTPAKTPPLLTGFHRPFKEST